MNGGSYCCSPAGQRHLWAASEPAAPTEEVDDEADDAIGRGGPVSGRQRPAARRVRWTPELHEQFVGAVTRLVGSCHHNSIWSLGRLSSDKGRLVHNMVVDASHAPHGRLSLTACWRVARTSRRPKAS